MSKSQGFRKQPKIVPERPRGASRSMRKWLRASSGEWLREKWLRSVGTQRNPAEPSENQPHHEKGQVKKSIRVASNVLNLLYRSIYLSISQAEGGARHATHRSTNSAAATQPREEQRFTRAHSFASPARSHARTKRFPVCGRTLPPQPPIWHRIL